MLLQAQRLVPQPETAPGFKPSSLPEGSGRSVRAQTCIYTDAHSEAAPRLQAEKLSQIKGGSHAQSSMHSARNLEHAPRGAAGLL